jgi:hypothetical protein
VILGIEIALVIYGILALIRGKFVVSSKKVVTGGAAYFLGILSLCPMPIAFVVILGVHQAGILDAQKDQLTMAVIEAAIVIGMVILIFCIGAAIGTDPAKTRRKKRRYEEDDEDEDEDDENEDRVARSRRKRRDEEDDEDDRPRRRRRNEEEDEDEDEDQPRRKRRDEEDDEDDRNNKRHRS